MSGELRWRSTYSPPRPIATWTLIGLNLLVWLVNIVSGLSPLDPDPRGLLLWGGNYLPATELQPWRLLSATFLHAGFLHLAMNMWALLDTGRIAERFFGSAQLVLIYLAAGVFGSLASLYFAARTSVAVGASGAIFGVVGALLAALYTKRHRLPTGFARALRSSMLAFTAFSLFMGFASSHIDNSAHLGGLISGFLLGGLMAGKFDPVQFARQAWPRAVLAVGAAAAAGLVAWKMVPRLAAAVVG